MRSISVPVFMMALFVVISLNAAGQVPDPPCVPDVVLDVADIELVCADMFEDAQVMLQTTFGAIQARDIGCDIDYSDNIRVEQINWIKPNGKYFVPLDLEEVVSKLDAFEEGEYDYTVAKTQKLFHYYLIFKPGIYEVFYHVLDDTGKPIDTFGATKTQIISVDSGCSGCLGSLGCTGCAGCRDNYIPDSIRELELKRMLSDWLLVGMCALGMMCWSAIQRR